MLLLYVSTDANMSGGRYRGWCYTLNNYTEGEVEALKRVECVYHVFGYEVAPETGTPHLQGYIYFKGARALGGMKKIIPRAHLEVAMGTAEQNRRYCLKLREGDTPNERWFEEGVMPQQGVKRDIVEAAKEIREGRMKAEDVIEDDFEGYHKYGRTLEKCEEIARSKVYRTEMTQGLWIWGKPGVGKSRMAYEGFHPSTHYVWNVAEIYQCGYKGQETVIIDDFRGEIKYATLLRMVDRYPFGVPGKNQRGTTPFVAKRVIVTSPLPPEEVYTSTVQKDGIGQLLRRFTVLELKGEESSSVQRTGGVILETPPVPPSLRSVEVAPIVP